MAARAAWQQMDSEAELQAFGSNLGANRTTRWSRILIGLLAIAGVSFVTAYYVPMHRAHLSLTDRHLQLTHKSLASEQNLADLRSQLESLTQQLEPLVAAQQQDSAAKSTAAKQLDSAQQELAAKLAHLGKKTRFEVSTQNGRVTVRVPSSVVFLPTTTTLSPGARTLFCEVAKMAAAGGYSLEVSSVVEDAAPAAGVPGVGAVPTAWGRSAAAAAGVAEVLEQKCAVPAGGIQAVGRVVRAASAAASPSASTADRIELSLARRPLGN